MVQEVSFLIGAGCERDYEMPMGEEFIVNVFAMHTNNIARTSGKKSSKDIVFYKYTDLKELINGKVKENGVLVNSWINNQTEEEIAQLKLETVTYFNEFIKDIQFGKYEYFYKQRDAYKVYTFDEIHNESLFKEVLHHLIEESEERQLHVATLLLLWGFYVKIMNEGKIENIEKLLGSYNKRNVKLEDGNSLIVFGLYILLNYEICYTTIENQVYEVEDNVAAKTSLFLLKTLMKLGILDFNDFLLNLMIEYMKDRNMKYFHLAESANDYLNHLLSIKNSHNRFGFYDWIKLLNSRETENNHVPFKFKYAFTANYTNLINKTQSTFEDILKIHGELNKYYDFKHKKYINTKEVDTYPYLILQTTAKIVDEVELLDKHLKMYNSLSEANEPQLLIIVGMGLNSDDTHITNLLIKLLTNNNHVSIAYFNYIDKSNKKRDLTTLMDKFHDKLIEIEYPGNLMNEILLKQKIDEAIEKAHKRCTVSI